MRTIIAVVLLACSPPGKAHALVAGYTPQTNYMLHCQGCHLPDGRGWVGKVPDIRGQLGRFLLTPEGRSYLVRVPGVANSMVSNGDLAELLNWLLPAMGTRQGSFKPYTASEVGHHRRTPLRDVAGTRQRLLAASTAGFG